MTYNLPKQSSSYGWLKYAILGVAIGLIAFALWFFRIEPIFGLVQGAYAWGVSVLSSITAWLGSIPTMIQNSLNANPIPTVAGLVSGTTSIGSLVYAAVKRQAASTATQLKEQADVQAHTSQLQSMAVTRSYDQLSNLNTQLVDEKKALESKVTELQKQLDDEGIAQVQEALTKKTAEVNDLRSQVNALQQALYMQKVQVKEIVTVK